MSLIKNDCYVLGMLKMRHHDYAVLLVFVVVSAIVTGGLLAIRVYNMTLFDDDATLIVFAHQDDDLLWMQPFLDSATTLLLAASPPAPAHAAVIAQHPKSYRDRWQSVFPGTSTDQEWIDSFALRDRCLRDQEWNYEKLAAAIDRWVSKPKVIRIVTHNNWGEYGHIHHRWVNRAVREAAVRHKKDVWMLNTLVLFYRNNAVYLDLGDWGLPSVRTTFSVDYFFKTREIYQKTKFDGQPAGLDTWTWFDGADQYPYGERTFVKIVDHGRDYSLDDPLIRKTVSALQTLVPVKEACTQQPEQSK